MQGGCDPQAPATPCVQRFPGLCGAWLGRPLGPGLFARTKAAACRCNWLCGFGQVTTPLWASLFASDNGHRTILTTRSKERRDSKQKVPPTTWTLPSGTLFLLVSMLWIGKWRPREARRLSCGLWGRSEVLGQSRGLWAREAFVHNSAQPPISGRSDLPLAGALPAHKHALVSQPQLLCWADGQIPAFTEGRGRGTCPKEISPGPGLSGRRRPRVARDSSAFLRGGRGLRPPPGLSDAPKQGVSGERWPEALTEHQPCEADVTVCVTEAYGHPRGIS